MANVNSPEFGVTTFLIRFYDNAEEIIKHIKERELGTVIEQKKRWDLIRTKYPGVFIRYIKLGPKCVDLFAAANKILYPEAEWYRPMTESSDTDTFKVKMTDIITELFGNINNLCKLRLDRIEFGANIMLEGCTAGQYIELIRRSVDCDTESFIFPDKAHRKDMGMTGHKFSVWFDKFGTFTAYDTYNAMNCNVEVPGLLILELAISHTYKNNESEHETIQNILDTLCNYVRECREYFEAFVYASFHTGKYFPDTEVMEIAGDSGITDSEKNNLRVCIKRQLRNHMCFRDIMKTMRKKFGSVGKLDNILALMADNDISPVVIPFEYDKCGYIPSLHELLGFKRG